MINRKTRAAKAAPSTKKVAAKATPAAKKAAPKTKLSLLKDLRKKLQTDLAHVDALIQSTEAK